MSASVDSTALMNVVRCDSESMHHVTSHLIFHERRELFGGALPQAALFPAGQSHFLAAFQVSEKDFVELADQIAITETDASLVIQREGTIVEIRRTHRTPGVVHQDGLLMQHGGQK